MNEMRRLLNLMEAVANRGMMPDGKRYTINRNPSRQEFLALLKGSVNQELRGILVGDDLYIWDSYALTHREVERQYGRSSRDLVFPGTGNAVEYRGEYASDDADEEEISVVDEANRFIESDLRDNPKIKALFSGAEFSLDLYYIY